MNNVVPISEKAFRRLPENQDVETALVASLLMNNRGYEKVGELLRPEHFSNPVAMKVFSVIQKMAGQNMTFTPMAVKTYLEADREFQALGGLPALDLVTGSLVTNANVGDYAKQVYDLYVRRQLIATSDDMANDAMDINPESPAPRIIEKYEQELFNIASSGQSEGGPITLGKAAELAIKNVEKAMRHSGSVVGTTTGLRDLDRQLGGLHPSDLVVLAARPGMGKTALATGMAVAAASQRDAKGVVFFSLEMSGDQLAARIMADVSGVDSHSMRTGKMRNDEFTKLVVGVSETQNLPLHIDDTASLSVPGMRSRVRRLHRKLGGLNLIIVDYIQLIEQLTHRQGDSRVNEISAVTRQLKAMAKEFQVPVLALSQLSRQVETRTPPMPRLSDLRDSGSIEQDADVVMFIYRPEYYQKDDTDLGDQNIAIIDVAKQRHGPTGEVRVYFDAKHTAFRDLAK